MTEKEKTSIETDRPELEEKLSELDILSQSLADAKRKEASAVDQLLRLGADFENFRKRSEKRVQEARDYGKEEILLQVISLMDILTQAVDAADKAHNMDTFKQGLRMVHNQFEKFLTDQGLVKIQTLGTKMNPLQHEALSQEEKDGAEEGTILGEIQPGYTKDGRVVRTAKVHVAAEKKQSAASEMDPESQEEKHV